MRGLRAAAQSLKDSLATEQETLALKEAELLAKGKILIATEREKGALEEYLTKIKPGCDFITDNLQTRKDNRVEETEALKNAKSLIEGTPVYIDAVNAAHNETLGDCLSICAGNEEHVDCKACLAGVTVPGYCAGHQNTTGC